MNIILQTAERALASSLGPQDKLNIKFLGNSPSAVYSYRFREKDAATPAPTTSARIFFFKAFIVSGDLMHDRIDAKVTADFLWLDRHEATQLFADQRTNKYWRCIQSSLFHERMPDRMVAKIISRVKAGAMKHAVDNEISRQKGSSAVR